jgi:hypothetical protein
MSDEARRTYAARNDVDFAYEIEGLARFRGNAFVDRKGCAGVFRRIPVDIVNADALGISRHVLDLCNLSKGLVLVTGPTGSGKSTTLAALIDRINATRRDHIITIEDPIEFVHPDKRCLISQREVRVHTEGFRHALRAALREDTEALDGLAHDVQVTAVVNGALNVTAIAELPVALRRRVIRGWLLAGGAAGLTDGQIRAVDALVVDWRGRGAVAVGGGIPRTRLFAERRGALLTLRTEPV